MNNNQNIIFQELIKNQRKNLPPERKLNLSDLKRLSTYLSKSIFIEECSIWNGYITEFKNNTFYINFFFSGKKHALHRLLYFNFIADISSNEYLKHNCANKGRCCSLNHIKKFNQDEHDEGNSKTSTEASNNIDISNNQKELDIIKPKKNITVEF